MRYLHSNERRRGAEAIQVWKSDVTGRQFEVRESNSFAASDQLSPGATGYLDFTGGSTAVTRKPLERAERLGRYQRRKRPAGTATRRNDARNYGGWVLIGALLLVVIWALL